MADAIAQGLNVAAAADPEPISRAVLSFTSAIKSLIGQEHKYANILTQPNVGAQWKLQYEVLPAIIDNYIVPKEKAGTITRGDYDLAIQALVDTRDGFFKYLQDSGLINHPAGKQANADFLALFDGGHAFGQDLQGYIPYMQAGRDRLPGGYVGEVTNYATGLLDSLVNGASKLLGNTGTTAPANSGQGTALQKILNGSGSGSAVGSPAVAIQDPAIQTSNYMPLILVAAVVLVIVLLVRR